jgi:hypothetical protein
MRIRDPGSRPGIVLCGCGNAIHLDGGISLLISSSVPDLTNMSPAKRPLATPTPASTDHKKRRRTSAEELKILEDAYMVNTLPSSEERTRLAERTGMTARAVQIWVSARERVFSDAGLCGVRKDDEDAFRGDRAVIHDSQWFTSMAERCNVKTRARSTHLPYLRDFRVHAMRARTF